MDFLNKPVGQQWYPYNLQGSPLNIMYTLKFWESPNTDDLEFQTFVLCKHNRFCLQILQARFQCFVVSVYN